METLIQILKDINIAQLLAMFAMGWFLYNRLKAELKGDIAGLKGELKGDIAKLSDKVEDVDRRLCRIEGSLATHGHCLFHQSNPEKKAE